VDLLFLGTSSGTPTRTRNVSGLALLEDKGRGWYLIDCGEATQHQVLRTSLSLHALRAIFITHVHGDHCYGLPGLLASAAMSGRRELLHIVAPLGIDEWVETTLSLTHTHLTYPLQFHSVESLGKWRSPFLHVEAIRLSHRVPSYAYRFTEARPDVRLDIERLEAEGVTRGPLWGHLARGEEVVHDGRPLRGDDYLLPGRPPRCVVVGGDNDRPELLRESCRHAQVLVHEATYTRDLAEKGRSAHGHSSAQAVAEFAESAGVANLVLTHFSARYQNDPARSPSIEDLRTEAQASYKGRLFLAADLQRYHLDVSGCLQVLDSTTNR
jgi:ribonuclease Z